MQKLEAISWDAPLALISLSLLVHVGPPLVCLVLAGAVALGIQLIPRVRCQNIVDILDLVVPPDRLVHVVPSQRLERVVDVRQRHPAALVQLAQQTLVGKLQVARVIVHKVNDLLEDLVARVDDLQAAVHEAQGPDGRVGADGLGRVRVCVLGGKGTVGGDPVLWVVGLFEGVADAGVSGGKDTLALALCGGGGVVEFHGHELVHVLQDEHVRVELDDAVILHERKGGELGPAVVEARVVGVVLCGLCGQEILDLLVGDAARLEGVDAFLGEGVCVKGHKRVGRVVFFEGVVQGDEAREVGSVGDECCPDFGEGGGRGS